MTMRMGLVLLVVLVLAPSAYAASVTVNGGSTAISVAPSTSVTVTVSGGTGSTSDWVGLYAAGAIDTAYLNWTYLSGTKSVGPAMAGIPFVMPSTVGNYEFRFFANNGFTKLATTAAVTVAVPPPLPPPPSTTLGTISIVPAGTGVGAVVFYGFVPSSGNATVTLAPMANPGSSFKGFTGDARCLANTLMTLAPTDNLTCTATFTSP